MKNFMFFVSILILFSCNAEKRSLNTSKKFVSDTIKLVAQTPKILKTPESVYFYSPLNVLFVSNINGSPSADDGNGFISEIDTNAKILNLHWVDGLNAPKGMGVYDSLLFVTDIRYVVMIDIKKAKVLKKFFIPGSKFLNDIAIDKKGVIYITDTQVNKLFALYNGKISVVIDNGLKSPNGLLLVNNILYIGNTGFLAAYDLSSKKLRKLCSVAGGIDGLKKIGSDSFIVSDWTGNIRFIYSNCQKKLVLTPVSKTSNAADFEYIASKRLLFVPRFFDNKVSVFRLVKR
jgi:hypothetical protein